MLPIHRVKDLPAHTEPLLMNAADAVCMLSMGESIFWREVGNNNVPPPVNSFAQPI